MRVILKMTSAKEKAFSIMLMGIYISVNMFKINVMDMVPMFHLMEKGMKVSGNMIMNMDKEERNLLMGRGMRGCLLKGRKVDKDI